MNNARIYEIILYVKRLIYVFFRRIRHREPINLKTVQQKGFFSLCQCRNEENILPFFRLYVMSVEETGFYID